MSEVGDEGMSIRDLKDLIPTFDGTKSLLNDFIEACNFADDNVIEGKKDVLVFLIKAKLTGQAKTFISSRNLKTWAQIRPLLVGQFGDCRDTEALVRDLMNSFQKVNETPRNFIQRIENLLTQLRSSVALDDDVEEGHKEILNKSHEKLALKTILAGINDPLGQLIRAQRPEDIKEASQYILEEENIAYLKAGRQVKPSLISKNVYPRTNYVSSQSHHAQNVPPRFHSNSHTKSPQQDVKICNYCKKSGHLIVNCFKRNKKFGNQNNNQPPRPHVNYLKNEEQETIPDNSLPGPSEENQSEI